MPRARSQSVIVLVGMVSCGRKTKVRRSVQRAKFSCSKFSCSKLLRLKMAKRCQEEYEDVSEVLHPSTLSTLYMYVPWPRLNVCLTCLLNSPCIRRFFVNLSDSLSFALLSSEAVSLFPV